MTKSNSPRVFGALSGRRISSRCFAACAKICTQTRPPGTPGFPLAIFHASCANAPGDPLPSSCARAAPISPANCSSPGRPSRRDRGTLRLLRPELLHSCLPGGQADDSATVPGGTTRPGPIHGADRSRTAGMMAAKWAGVVPQHPPTILTPRSRMASAAPANCSGVTS